MAVFRGVLKGVKKVFLNQNNVLTVELDFERCLE